MSDSLFVAANDAVSKALNSTIPMEDLYKYIDNSICMTYMNQPGVKDVFTKAGETKRALDALYTLDLITKLFYTERQISSTATGFFDATAHNFRRIITNRNAEQLVIYSAHDTTIMNFLVAMNLTNAECVYSAFKNKINTSDTCVIKYPTYTSNIIFQLYEYPNQTHTFRIRYNGQYKQIPFCNWWTECSVHEFHNWLEVWREKDYVKSCGVYNTEAETYFTFAVV